MEQLAARLVEVSAGKGERRMCSECGQAMRYKGRKACDVITETGEVRFERGYYYCQTCRKGIFPLDEQWGLNEPAYSPERAKQMVWLSGLRPYEQASQIFQRVGHCLIPTTSIWNQTQQHGERLKQQVDRQQENVSVERVILPPAGQDHR